jgi:hypothetical protein
MGKRRRLRLMRLRKHHSCSTHRFRNTELFRSTRCQMRSIRYRNKFLIGCSSHHCKSVYSYRS